MALEGSLRDFDLFSLFNMIKIQGKSGTLVLSRGQEFVKIFFDQGEIVGCDSNQVRMEDRVGTMLVRLNRLTGDELLQMVEQQRRTLKRMGTLLLESGKVTTQDLQDALFNQAMAIIYRTFRWREGDYRFDSMLPADLDREHFLPIPVDTVLMEAARIQDEWPEVQKRLPDLDTPLTKSALARDMRLDIDRELSSILEGSGGAHDGTSGLTHEQETVLTYFDQPQSIQEVLQVSRYEELDTCKIIADLMQASLLEIAPREVARPQRPWTGPVPILRPVQPERPPSVVLWVAVAALILVPVFTYVPSHRGGLNLGLASLQPTNVAVPLDSGTKQRLHWAMRLASPADGGANLAPVVGRAFDGAKNPVKDFTRQPDPMAPAAPPAAPPAPAPAAPVAP